MALVLADRVLETTSVAGTGDAALGGAQTGFQPFSVIGNGSTTYYTIVGVDANHQPTGEWEVGVGTYVSAGNYISRDTVLSSSNGGAKVYFASGTKDIFLDLPSEEVLLSAGNVTGPTSAVANNFVLFDGTTGKLIKDAGYNASAFATAAQGAKADTAVQPGSLGTAAYLDAGSALGVATLDAGGKVPTSQIPQMGDLNYQGTWNASTNIPTLTSSAGTKGFYYVVSVAGSTNLNGITDWKVGDWAVFNGSVWEKIDNTDAVTSVNGYTGTVVLTATDVGAAPATSGTSILYGNGSGGTSNVTVGSGLTFVAGTLASTGGGGTGDVVGPSSATDNAIARFDTTTGKLIQNSVTTIDDTGNASGILSQQFSNGSAVTLAAGKLWYDGSTGAWNAGMGNGNITQQIGEELFVYGKASAAITDSPLQIVYHTGTVGASGVITFAPTIAGITDENAIIGIATESLALNAFGRITTFGTVRGITTNGSAFGETWADDDVIWYNPVTGNPTNIKPVAPNIKFQIGTVIKAGAGGSGSFQVALVQGTQLGGTDSNVKLTSPANGNILTYDGGNGYWKNTDLTAGTGISVSKSVNGVLTVTNSAPDQTVAITGAGGAVVTGTYPNFTITTPSGTVTSVTGTAPVVSSGGATPAISMAAATTSVSGYLTSTDWNTFNNKTSNTGTVTSVAALTLGTTGTDLSSTVATGTTTPVITLQVPTASATNRGALSSADWTTFNGKYSVGGALGTPSSGTLTNCTGYTYANLSGTVPTWNQNTTGTAAGLSATLVATSGGTGQSTYAIGDLLQGGATNTLTKLAAVATGNALISGGVTTASSWGKIGLTTHVSGTLAVGNGGTGVATLTGLVKGTGTTAMVAATAGTDYSVGTSALATGILKSTTTTGALTIAVAADFPTLNQNTTGSSASCTGNAATATTATNQSGGTVNATSATIASGNSINFATSYNQPDAIKIANDANWTFGSSYNGALQYFMQVKYYGDGTSNRGFRVLNTNGGAAVLFANDVGTNITGAFTATGSVTAFFSDDRLKTRHGKIENALDKIQSLEGFYYTPNQVAQDLGYEAIQDVGVSAQAVQAILPEVVAPAPIDDKYLTVRYEKLVPLLIEAIKELKAEVDSLKGK